MSLIRRGFGVPPGHSRIIDISQFTNADTQTPQTCDYRKSSGSTFYADEEWLYVRYIHGAADTQTPQTWDSMTETIKGIIGSPRRRSPSGDTIRGIHQFESPRIDSGSAFRGDWKTRVRCPSGILRRSRERMYRSMFETRCVGSGRVKCNVDTE